MPFAWANGIFWGCGLTEAYFSAMVGETGETGAPVCRDEMETRCEDDLIFSCGKVKRIR